MKLYVGNLAYSTTEDELKQIFSEFGIGSRPWLSSKESHTPRSLLGDGPGGMLRKGGCKIG